MAYYPCPWSIEEGWQPVVHIGFAFCDTWYDKFDKNLATMLSDMKAQYLSRAKKFDFVLRGVPYKHREDFKFCVKRACRYFNDKNMPVWVMEMVVEEMIIPNN